MKITAYQMNAIASMLSTTDKSLVINTVIKALTDAGVSVNVAVDEVFGSGFYKKMADEIYDELRAA